MANKNLTNAKKAKKDELTPSQKAKKKYELKHRTPDSEFLKELRNPYIKKDWFEIKGFPNYFINKKFDIYFSGDISNPKFRRKSKFITKTLLKIGYYVVSLNHKKVFLHRIIAQTFIPNPNNLPEVDHINRDTKDNRIENLRWVTHKENLNNENTRKVQSNSHLGLISNIKGRRKVWIDKSLNIFKMV